MVRSLSPKEARVIQLLLARVPGPDQRRIELSGYGDSTYFTIRRRALARGWLTERYVPDPAPLGVRRVLARLGRPFAEGAEEAARTWAARPGTVVLWRFRDSLLSVVWETAERPAPRGAPPPVGPPTVPGPFRDVWPIAVPASEGAIPVYFDFEGAWARWSGSGSPVGYPVGLDGIGEGAPEAAPVSPSARTSVLPMVEASLRAGESSRSRSVPPMALPPWLHRRMYPAFARVPPVAGQSVDEAVFVTGRWLEAGRPRELVEALFREAEVAPFLLAYDRDRLLMGLLGPRPSKAGGHATPVVDVLRRHLGEVETHREPLRPMVAIVDHDYREVLRGPIGAAGTRPAPEP
jgi:hypothetical protein